MVVSRGFLALAFFTTALIAAVTHPASFLYRLRHEILRYIGRRSYGIYLWHWPIFMVTRPGIDVEWSEPVTFVVRIALTLVIAELSYRLVEMPIRRGVLGRSWSAVRSGGALGVRAIGTLIATGLVTVIGAAVAIALLMNPGDGRDAIPPDVAEAMGIADGGPLELAIDDETSMRRRPPMRTPLLTYRPSQLPTRTPPTTTTPRPKAARLTTAPTTASQWRPTRKSAQRTDRSA